MTNTKTTAVVVVTSTSMPTLSAAGMKRLVPVVDGVVWDTCVIKEEPDSDSASTCSPPPLRKRQRLDHLSIEEKIMRRKLKNRVAAQTARDRKKIQMDQMEIEIQELQARMAKLEAENGGLRLDNERLKQETADLKHKLTTASEQQHQQSLSAVDVPAKLAPLEYASLISVSQQKRQGLSAVATSVVVRRLTTMLFVGLMMSRLRTSSISSTNWTTTSSSAPSTTTLVLPEVRRRFMQPPIKWWGPEQRSWNPCEN